MPKTPTPDRAHYTPETLKVTVAAEDLAAAAPLIDTARARIRDQRRGMPGSGLGSTGPSSGDHSSPVEAALGLTGTGPAVLNGDPAEHRLAELDRLIKAVAADARRILQIVQGNTPHAPSDRDRAAVRQDNDPLCEHCTRHRPTGKVEPVHRTGDVNGVLAPLSMGLCLWCYRYVREVGKLPSKQDIDRHNKGLKRLVRAT